MTIELTVANAIALLSLFGGALWALVKIITSQWDRRLAERITGLTDALNAVATDIRRQSEGLAKLERDFLAFKGELPLHYVRREDYVQAVASIMTKLDAMALRFENILFRGETRER